MKQSPEKKSRKAHAEKFFQPGNFYQEVFVDGYWYTKTLNRGNILRPDKWIIGEYSEESFNRYKEYKENYHSRPQKTKESYY